MMLPPASLADHLPRRRLAEMKHAGQIDRDDALPLAVVEVQKAAAMTDPGAIEQHVEPAELAYRRRHCGIDRGALAHIECRRGRPTAGGADPRGRGFGRGAIDVGAQDGRTRVRQTLRTSAADPPTATRHKRHLSRDACHRDPPAIPARHYRATLHGRTRITSLVVTLNFDV